jgi:hypothetical protein
MSTTRSNDRASLCSFTLADGRHCRTLDCGGLAAAFEAKAPAIHARKESASTTLCALCALLSVPSVVNPFPRSQSVTGQAK